jgi:hypothetical protein
MRVPISATDACDVGVGDVVLLAVSDEVAEEVRDSELLAV